MNLAIIILVAALVFGICYLVDKGFTRLFRSKAQHRSGKAIRASKRYGGIGTVLMALGSEPLFWTRGCGSPALWC